jgi:hypothetical protein
MRCCHGHAPRTSDHDRASTTCMVSSCPETDDGMGPACSAGGPDQRARRPRGTKHDVQPLTTTRPQSHRMACWWPSYSTLSGHSISFVRLLSRPPGPATPRRDKASMHTPAGADSDAYHHRQQQQSTTSTIGLGCSPIRSIMTPPEPDKAASIPRPCTRMRWPLALAQRFAWLCRPVGT